MVLVLGRKIVYGQSTVYLRLSKYIVFENTLTHIATVASGTEGVAAVSCMESHMNRRPLGSIDQTRSVRLSFTQSADADGRGSPYTARSMTGTGMLLVRGLPLRVLGRQMRHGRKGCRRTDKDKLRGASRRQHKKERRGVCVYPSWAVSMPLCFRPARVCCLQQSLVAKEFSQHRHRSFRLVISSLQI